MIDRYDDTNRQKNTTKDDMNYGDYPLADDDERGDE